MKADNFQALKIRSTLPLLHFPPNCKYYIKLIDMCFCPCKLGETSVHIFHFRPRFCASVPTVGTDLISSAIFPRDLRTFTQEYLLRWTAAKLQFKMVWEGQGREGSVEYEFYSFLPRTKDYYKILELDYDATLDAIRSNYLRLALKWHPDKQQGQNGATLKFQEINEAYKVLSDPVKRREYDVNGVCDVEDYNLIEYLHRFKGLILTCNGLGMGNAPRWY